MQEYDVALKLLLRGSAQLTIRELTGASIEIWLGAELPKIQNLRVDLLVRGGGRRYQNGGPLFANLSPRLSLFSDHLRTVLAVKGSLRRAQQRRALDGSGPFRTTLLRRGKGSLRTAPMAGDHFAAILVPFFAATDICWARLLPKEAWSIWSCRVQTTLPWHCEWRSTPSASFDCSEGFRTRSCSMSASRRFEWKANYADPMFSFDTRLSTFVPWMANACWKAPQLGIT